MNINVKQERRFPECRYGQELNKIPRWAIYEDGNIQSYYGIRIFHTESEAEYVADELAGEEPLVNHEYYVAIAHKEQ